MGSSAISPAAQIPWFGRAWNITINTQAGQNITLSSDQFAEPLRVIFTINTMALLAYWDAEIRLYNPSAALAQQLTSMGLSTMNPGQGNLVLSLGDQVSISGGYQYGPAGSFVPGANLLYKGAVFQTMWTREDAVDYRLTIRCLLGFVETALGFVSLSIASGATDAQIIGKVADQLGLQQEQVDTGSMNTAQAPRGQTIFNRGTQALQRIAKDNNLAAWISPNGLNMRTLEGDPNAQPQYIYGPPDAQVPPSTANGAQVTKTIIGVPQQTQDGIVFRILMDSRPKIFDLVQIAPGTPGQPFTGTAVNQLPLQFQGKWTVPNPSGVYLVAGIRHSGDTRGRGDDWYTEITAVTLKFFPDWLASRSISGTGNPSTQ